MPTVPIVEEVHARLEEAGRHGNEGLYDRFSPEIERGVAPLIYR